MNRALLVAVVVCFLGAAACGGGQTGEEGAAQDTAQMQMTPTPTPAPAMPDTTAMPDTGMAADTSGSI